MSLPPEALPGAFELPAVSLDVEAQDLGNGVKAVGLELIETNNREPVTGEQAAEIWSAAFPALTAKDFLAVDFFSHLERVVWCSRVLRRSSCASYARASKRKPLVCAQAQRQRNLTPLWRGICPNAASMHTSRLTSATAFAQSATSKTAGLLF
jgi:hypothetical protein